MPHLSGALENAAVLVVVGAVVGEFLGGGKGFGELIRVAASQLDPPPGVSLMTYRSPLGLHTFWAVIRLQCRFAFWCEGKRGRRRSAALSAAGAYLHLRLLLAIS